MKKQNIGEDTYKKKSWLLKEIKIKTISEISKEQNCSRQNILYFIDKFNLKHHNPQGRPTIYNNKERVEAFKKTQTKYRNKRAENGTNYVINGVSKTISYKFKFIRDTTKRNNNSIVSEMLELFLEKNSITPQI